MELFEAFKRFSDVAEPIIIKSDVVRLGLRFSDRAKESFKERKDILYKGFWLFSYDKGEPVMYGDNIPFLIILDDGTEEGTTIQVRTSEDTPYMVDIVDGEYKLFWNEEPIGRVGFDKPPKFFERMIDGIPMASLVQGARDTLFVTANKHCDYFSIKKECLFCDLTPHAAAQKKKGETMILRKKGDMVAEVLEIGLHESRFRHLFITGGTFLKEYEGKKELDWYCDFLESIRKRLKVWYPVNFQIGALDDEGWKRLKDTGITNIEPNIEVWNRKLFEIICPGKASHVGYDEWIKRTIRAVDFFGVGNVNPNFVSGVEMAKPFGFTDVDEAVESTVNGFDFLMSHGVLPRQGDFWCIEQKSKLSHSEPPPLEYFIKLGIGYLEVREKYGFMSPTLSLCRYCLPHGTEYDFEYWHGNGPYSKKNEKGG
jgi:hypothetical protein